MKESDHNSYVFFRDLVGESTPETRMQRTSVVIECQLSRYVHQK